MEMVTLKNGSELPAGLVTTAMVSLRRLMAANPIAFFELVAKCRDPQHRFFGNTSEVLRSHALLEADGRPHDALRDVIVSAVTGEGLAMMLSSPVRESPTSASKG